MTALRAFLRPIRLGAAMAMVCALCLPLSECKQGKNTTPPPSKQTLQSEFFPQSNNQATYEYAVGELGFTAKGVFTLAAFTWPLLWILVCGRWMESRFSWIFHLLEVPFCVGTGYVFVAITLCGDWLYGGYVVIISVGLFTCTALVFLACALWAGCRKLWGKIRGSGDAGRAVADLAPGG